MRNIRCSIGAIFGINESDSSQENTNPNQLKTPKNRQLQTEGIKVLSATIYLC